MPESTPACANQESAYIAYTRDARAIPPGGVRRAKKMTYRTVSANDVAAYILACKGSVTAMKLQKLLYYSQAWSLVWDESPLFHEGIEAWANGPVVPAIYDRHRGEFRINEWPVGDPAALDSDQKETVDAVLEYYGDKPAQWLSDLTHAEAPWRDARRGLPDGVRGQVEITHQSMAEYYGSLSSDPPLG